MLKYQRKVLIFKMAMRISCDFPGGNIIVRNVDEKNGIVSLTQDNKGTKGSWFWWCFCVENAPDKTIIFKFNDQVIGNYGPCYSYDGENWLWLHEASYGEQWEWGCQGTNSHNEFSFEFHHENKVYFAFSLPYTVRNFECLYQRIADEKSVALQYIGMSERKRQFPVLKMGSGKRNIVMTARQHCCESTGSYALEGVILALINHASLLEQFTFHIFPFVDLDGVEEGEQGKDRAPHDHNRDYIHEPIYRATRLIVEYVKDMEIEAFLDFHSPWKWTTCSDIPHIHKGSSSGGANELIDLFIRQLHELTYKADEKQIRLHMKPEIVGYGVVDNVEGTTDSKNYFSLVKKARVSCTIETPYAGCLRQGYTVEQLHKWGYHILQALEYSLC